jgi:hypothetical protein
MEQKQQERLLRYLPQQFLRRSLVSGDERPQLILGCEHDFDFPVFGKSEDAKSPDAKQKWNAYWEYLSLNCGGSRPYAPCWDPIALQEKTAEVFLAISERLKPSDPNHAPPLTDLYQRFRSVMVGDMLQTWGDIQKQNGYSDHDASVLMRRFERAMKKVFYFLMCCKRILFCEGCLAKFSCCLEGAKELDGEHQKQYNYALKCTMCEREQGITKGKEQGNEQGKKRLQRPVYKQIADLNELMKSSHGKQAKTLKAFCFQWFMKVGFNFKKACSTSLLRHHGHPELYSADKVVYKPINLSHSRAKLGNACLTDFKERSRLRQLFLQVVEICQSEMVVVQRETFENSSVDASSTLSEAMLSIVITSEHINKVVAECYTLKTGCSTYEPFPALVVDDAPKPQAASRKTMTHLMVAAIEGSLLKASAYIAGADIPYIYHEYEDDVRYMFYQHDGSGSCRYMSCALHMALERGNTDVATAIINRTFNIVRGDSFDSDNTGKVSKTILDGLFLGASVLSTRGEVPTSFMYLARYAMRDAMDKLIAILRYLNNEDIQRKLLEYMIRPTDSNGMNALHYAVMSQSPECVKWFLPYMHDFHICDSSAQGAFVPRRSHHLQYNASERNCESLTAKMTKTMGKPAPFDCGYPKLLRTRPPSDFSDSDCRLVVSEDWIQVHGNKIAPAGDTALSVHQHREMSPYELALLMWRLLDIESQHAQDRVHNIHTNSSTGLPIDRSSDPPASSGNGSSQDQDKLGKSSADPLNTGSSSDPKDIEMQNVATQSNPPASNGNDSSEADDNKQAIGMQTVAIQSSPSASSGNDSSEADDSKQDNQSAAENDDLSDHEDASPERLAEAYEQRSNLFSRILSDLEEAAGADVEIDAKKKKGLRQFSEYRRHRAISRMVFPVIAYIGYVAASTLMAFLMTNGLMDEPTKFTHGVINELQWGANGVRKNINDIASYDDLTVFWGVLAGFLWSASPMARPFGSTY